MMIPVPEKEAVILPHPDLLTIIGEIEVARGLLRLHMGSIANHLHLSAEGVQPTTITMTIVMEEAIAGKAISMVEGAVVEAVLMDEETVLGETGAGVQRTGEGLEQEQNASTAKLMRILVRSLSTLIPRFRQTPSRYTAGHCLLVV